MEQQFQTYRFIWQAIEFEATYTPLQWGVIAHLAIRSIAPEGACRSPAPAIARTSTGPAPSKRMAAMSRRRCRVVR